MSKGLLLRGRIWHVHLHVPGNLAALFVRKQIRFSTGLTDKRQALQVAQRVRDELLTLSYERRLADLVSKKNKKSQIVRKEMIERTVLEFGSDGKPTKQTTDRIDTGDDDEDRWTSVF